MPKTLNPETLNPNPQERNKHEVLVAAGHPETYFIQSRDTAFPSSINKFPPQPSQPSPPAQPPAGLPSPSPAPAHPIPAPTGQTRIQNQVPKRRTFGQQFRSILSLKTFGQNVIGTQTIKNFNETYRERVTAFREFCDSTTVYGHSKPRMPCMSSGRDPL